MPDVESKRHDEAEHCVITAWTRQTRRSLLATTLVAGACLAASRSASALDDQPGSDERPQKDDLLVVSEGPQSGQVITPSLLTLGGPPVHVWPKDPKTS